ncbi:MAG: sigma factor [Bacteroidota bacterium]
MKNDEIPEFATDAGLIAGIMRKEKIALSLLYDKYAPTIFAVIYGITGDRMISETLLARCFCAFWETAGNFNPRGPGLLSWMLRTAGGLARESLRTLENEIQEENKYVNDSKELINLEM